MRATLTNDKVEQDIRQNKVKEGALLKQSRHLKQWKQRWMVLTKTHFYSFSSRGEYKNPTEVIQLKEVETLKSYYKDQYKPYTFRIESPQVNLHMSAKSCDEKWAWMTAVEKMIQRTIHPQAKVDTHSQIRETIKMTNAVRQTIQTKQQNRKNSIDLGDGLLKKLRMCIQSGVLQQRVFPKVINSYQELSQQEQTFFVLQKKPASKSTTDSQKQQVQVKESNNKSILAQRKQAKQAKQATANTQKNQGFLIDHSQQNNKVTEKAEQQNHTQVKIVEKVVQKIVYVPIQKLVEKIVVVPEIQQKVIEKIVYKDSQKQQKGQGLQQVLKYLIENPGQNPTALVNFVVYLLTSSFEKYQDQVLQFCLDAESCRFFSQMFLLMLNQQTEEQKQNKFLKFVLVLYEHCDEYFYTSDMKALISILIRQMQMNRSQFHQHLIMLIFETFTTKSWWRELNYRTNDIKAFVKELQAISGQQNQFLATRLLQKL